MGISRTFCVTLLYLYLFLFALFILLGVLYCTYLSVAIRGLEMFNNCMPLRRSFPIKLNQLCFKNTVGDLDEREAKLIINGVLQNSVCLHS